MSMRFYKRVRERERERKSEKIHDTRTTLSIVKFIIILCKDMGGPQKTFKSFLDDIPFSCFTSSFTQPSVLCVFFLCVP